MKKALIAGAASLAVAAMPVVGVFAAGPNPHTDTLSITIGATCNFTAAATHADGTGTWSGNTLTVSQMANSTVGELGSTTMSVNCNDNDGWKVTANAAPLTGQTVTTNTIPVNASYSATDSGYAFTVTGDGAKEGIQTGGIIATDTTTTGASKTFTVTYSAGIDADQAADTYAGEVTYTLAAL